MAEDPRWRRIAPRPERQHLPFQLGHRHGALFAPGIVALFVSVLTGCAVAALLTWLLSRGGAP